MSDDRIDASLPEGKDRNLTRIYFVRCGAFVKIGRGDDVQHRVMQFNIGSPYPMEILGSFIGPASEERKLHKLFKKLKHKGEWFHLTSEVERFIQRETGYNPKRKVGRTFVYGLKSATREAAGLSKFCADRLDYVSGTYTLAKDMWLVWNDYCDKKGLDVGTRTQFGRLLGQIVPKERRGGTVRYLDVKPRYILSTQELQKRPRGTTRSTSRAPKSDLPLAAE